MKKTILAIFAVVAAVSIISMSGIAAPALAYKNKYHHDHDHDDHKDLRQFIYCVKEHRGGDISGYNLHKCGERHLEGV